MGAPTLDLTDNEIRLWCLPLTQVSWNNLEQSAEQVWSPNERQRAAHFAFERDRRQFLAGRYLLRSALSTCAAVSPAAWRFRPDRYGKPQLDAPATAPDLRFSVAHTPTMAAVAVALALRVGVDLECASRTGPWQDIASRYFAPEECRDLAALPEAEQRVAFFRLWTLKEAFLKALGTGLSTPLNTFRFELAPTQRPRVHFSPECTDSQKPWRFWLLASPPDQQLAVAVEHPVDRSPELVLRRDLPCSCTCPCWEEFPSSS
jgi:4'-phosphopantetheinyl transferase